MTSTPPNPETAASAAAEKLAAAGKETLEAVLKAGAETAETGCRNAAAAGQEHLDLARDVSRRAAAYGKDNLDALAESAAAVMSGWEACCAGLVDDARAAMAGHLDAMQRLGAARTPQEFLDVQIEAVNRSVTCALDQSTRLHRTAADTTARALDPVRRRVESAVETFVRPPAAAR